MATAWGRPSVPRTGWAMAHWRWPATSMREVMTGWPDAAVANQSWPLGSMLPSGRLAASTFPFRSVISTTLKSP